MAILTEIKTNEIIEVNPKKTRAIALVGVLEGLLDKISKNHLDIVGKNYIYEITLRDLGTIYKVLLNQNTGIHGVCWEHAIYNAIYFEDEYIMHLFNEAINMLTNHDNEKLIEAIIWGEDKNINVQKKAKKIFDDGDEIWTPIKNFSINKYIDIAYKAMNNSKLIDNLPNAISGIWKTDIFIKKSGEKEWFSVTVKWNKNKIESSSSGIFIGAYFSYYEKINYNLNPFKNNDFIYCAIPTDRNFGGFFIYIFNLVDRILKSININNLKRTDLIFNFSSPRGDKIEKDTFNWFHDNRDAPCVEIINFLKDELETSDSVRSEDKLIERTDRLISLPLINYKKIRADEPLIILPDNKIIYY